MPKLRTIGLAGFALIAFLSFDSVKTNELKIENYQNPWKLQNIMDRSKD
jgi:hypothetical protein